MTDISTSKDTSLEIFKAIMDHGPLSLYSATNKTQIPLGTVHRHFKQLSETGKIRVYHSKMKGRKKIDYGPTIQGLIHFYRQEPDFANKIENYFLLWIEHPEFRKELETEGFDVTLENLLKSKHVFRKYMDYFSAIEKEIEKIRKGEDIISHNLQIFLGSILLSSKPKYQNLLEDLYQELPGMQNSLENYMSNMTTYYNEFQKNFKKKHHLKTK